MPDVILSNLTLSYARHPAVHHLEGVFPAGSLTAVTGPNGGGKSTLLKALAGLMKPEEGSIRFEPARPAIAYLPQMGDFKRDFPLTVAEMAALGCYRSSGGFGLITAAQRNAVQAALANVGLEHFGDRQIDTLSAGQFQRALFARLIMEDAQLILLDEPFSAVDEATSAHLMHLIHGWHQQGKTIISVLHDLALIRAEFPYCLLLARECAGWGRPEDMLNPETLLRAQRFHEAWGKEEAPCPR